MLLITVRFHDGRYHGAGDWPPSPARLFQALVAGASQGGGLADDERQALRWLETLTPPLIAVPRSRVGQSLNTYVPNNDLDAVGGRPCRVSKIRAPKTVRPRLFDAGIPFLYGWGPDIEEKHARGVCRIADRLYQFGRGVDMAWATAELLGQPEVDERFAGHEGVLHRPTATGSASLACPVPGSFESLQLRFERTRRRFSSETQGRRRRQLFMQPPKPRFAMRSYDSPATRVLYELRETTARADLAAQPQTAVVGLVERIRDAASRRLQRSLRDQADTVARIFIGRGAGEADKDLRLRILPLPSVGHASVDRAIRRLLIEVPPDCPLPVDDIDWAFSGLEPHDPEKVAGWAVVPAADLRMLRHYGIGADRPARIWRTVTPAALPGAAGRRRIDPRRIGDEAKDGRERREEERRAVSAVLQALRHIRVTSDVASVRVQREPFAEKGARAEAFAPGTRFAKEQLWHVEIAFAEAASGPLAIGDGRYLGLGLMAPEPHISGRVAAYSIKAEPALPTDARAGVLTAVRRALMAIDRDLDPNGQVHRLFSGHEPDGAPAGDGRHRHVFLAAHTDASGARLDRLYVISPDAADRSTRIKQDDARRFERVTVALTEVRAGRLGVFRLRALPEPTADDRLFATATRWVTVTDYRPTRHVRRGGDPAAAVLRDVIAECDRRGLPKPDVELLDIAIGPNGGDVRARLRLRFAVAVAGPIVLGRDSHEGGGLLAALDGPRHAS